MTTDTQDAERLAELRRDWSDSDEIVAFLFDQLDARDARIAELERQVLSTMDSRVVSRDEHDAAVARLTAALADQRALAAAAQQGNAATIGELRTALAQAEAAREWRPLKTAPKDGSWLLMLCNDRERVLRVSWGRDRSNELWWCSTTASYGDGLFCGWLPCPAAPASPERAR